MNNTTRRIPQHVRIENYIRDDEDRSRYGWITPESLAELHSVRAAGLAEDSREGDDARAVEIAVYMYARRAGHWALAAMGERGPDLLATYYRQA